MTAKRYSHGMHTAARPTNTAKFVAKVRHGHDTEASHERIVRPIGSMPRKGKDWN
jgi:hypothetical protein